MYFHMSAITTTFSRIKEMRNSPSNDAFLSLNIDRQNTEKTSKLLGSVIFIQPEGGRKSAYPHQAYTDTHVHGHTDRPISYLLQCSLRFSGGDNNTNHGLAKRKSRSVTCHVCVIAQCYLPPGTVIKTRSCQACQYSIYLFRKKRRLCSVS